VGSSSDIPPRCYGDLIETTLRLVTLERVGALRAVAGAWGGDRRDAARRRPRPGGA